MANGNREYSKHHKGQQSVGELATGGLIPKEVERRASTAGAERPPFLGICTEQKPKPKELVCDGGKVGVMPKEPMLVAPLWEESENVKAVSRNKHTLN